MAKSPAPESAAPKKQVSKATPKATPKATTKAGTQVTASAKPSAVKAPVRRKSLASAPFILGIDIGGSGIKAAPVDLEKGVLVADRIRIDTPQPSTPEACAAVVAQLVRTFEPVIGKGTPIGCTFPGVVMDGITHTAANVDKSWIGLDADKLFTEACGRSFNLLNDAQAAAIAEVKVGAGKGIDGLVLMLTFGTGIGAALVYRGVALPGIELGHLRIKGEDAETRASAFAKEREGLSWKKWAQRVDTYIARLETVLWPELIIVGGGISADADQFLHLLNTRAPIVPAQLTNDAGIVGAAMAATWQANLQRP
jgi:polyphosphate glucokinase